MRPWGNPASIGLAAALAAWAGNGHQRHGELAALSWGPTPRDAWRAFLSHGFMRATFKVQVAAFEHLMEVAEDIPFNIQQLANVSWEQLRAGCVWCSRAISLRGAQEGLEDIHPLQLGSELRRTAAQSILHRRISAHFGDLSLRPAAGCHESQPSESVNYVKSQGFRVGFGPVRIIVLLAALAGLIIVVLAHVSGLEAGLLRADPEGIPGNPGLMRFARGRGEALFEAHCAGCHGTRGQGDPARGIPVLSDGDWLYGTGSVSDIEQVVKYGIRSYHPKAWNLAVMPRTIRAMPARAS